MMELSPATEAMLADRHAERYGADGGIEGGEVGAVVRRRELCLRRLNRHRG